MERSKRVEIMKRNLNSTKNKNQSTPVSYEWVSVLVGNRCYGQGST